MSRVIRGGFHQFLIRVSNYVLGAVFWILIGRYASPDTVGVAVAIVSLAGVLSSVFSLGIPTAMARYIGEYTGNRERIRAVVSTGLLAGFLLMLTGALAIYMASYTGLGGAGFNRLQLHAAALLVLLGVSNFFSMVFLGLIDLAPLLYANLAGNIAKIAISILLVIAGYGWLGIVIGYSTVSLAVIIAGVVYVARKIGYGFSIERKDLSNLLKAGGSLWVPELVALIGSPSIGVIAVFIGAGSYETGVFYIAFTLAGLSYMIASSIITVLLPHLSGQKSDEERIRTLIRSLRVGIALSTPLAVALMLYPEEIISLIGRDYSVGSQILIIAVIATLATIIAQALNTLLYSTAKYKKVMAINTAGSTVRLILYILLVPILGGLGAIISYTAGAIIILAIILQTLGSTITHRLLKNILKPQAPITLLLLGYTLKLTQIDTLWIMEALIIVILSYIMQIKIQAIKKDEIEDIAKAILSEKTYNSYRSKIKHIIDQLL